MLISIAVRPSTITDVDKERGTITLDVPDDAEYPCSVTTFTRTGSTWRGYTVDVKHDGTMRKGMQ